MSGHSKWSTIHRQKEVTDKKRGQLFSKLAKAISVAARGGADPEGNFKLRLAIEKAKQASMPKENILRAIERGKGGKGGEKWEEVVYEGYGPEGVAIIAEALTDNRNRTTSEIKNIFERGGGRLASPGAVSFQFKKAGLLTVEKSGDPDELILKIIDLGVEDVEEATDAIEVYTKPELLDQVKKNLLGNDLKVLGAELVMQSTTTVKLTNKRKIQKVLNFMENLENHDDVQRIFANFDILTELIGENGKKN